MIAWLDNRQSDRNAPSGRVLRLRWRDVLICSRSPRAARRTYAFPVPLMFLWCLGVAMAGFTETVLATPVTVTVSKAGSGSGTVTSNAGSILCDPTCSGDYEIGTILVLSAAPQAGSQFTGWLGPCTGTGACQFTVAAPTTVTATFASPPLSGRTLDIDATNTCDALTDGLLVIRHLFGLTGSSLTNGAVAPVPGRNDVEIANYLRDINPALDVDGDGRADALTDGLLIYRYLSGVRGPGLIAGAVGADATRKLSGDIEPLIASLCLPGAPGPTLSVSLAGLGSGTVSSLPAGIQCGAFCTGTFSPGTQVTLTAAPSLDSAFAGWNGACTGTGACVITMDSAKSVSAIFALNTTPVSPVDPTLPTDPFDSTAFLYSGANPIQTGVAPGTIKSDRVGVLRGTVHARDGTPLSGVTITVLGHPEFGQTKTRADGVFDMAANGGGLLTVNYQKAGLLSVQRAVTLPWRDFAWLPDVVMIALDTAVTPIDLSLPAMQTARGNPVTDSDGTRRATILVPPGTTATMVMPNGSTQPLTTISVRATEYTVGSSGPRAMPASLPPSSGYTYAAELSVDEAMAAGAVELKFNQPLPVYVENFLGFPVGGAVPTGYYDRVQGRWIASANGRVIKVLSITGNMADLDIAGAGVAANAAALAALGVSPEERTQLALLYLPGQTLWRVPIAHFSPWDCNWPFGPPPGAPTPPGGSGGGPGGGAGSGGHGDPKGKSDKKCGSVIGCDGQTLGESVPITGTPWRLHYQSDRASARPEDYSLNIAVSDATPLPASLKAMRVEVTIAGRVYQRTYAPATNVQYVLTWDGLDGYGRLLQGIQRADVKVHYDYAPFYYAVPADQLNSFARAEAAGAQITSSRQAAIVTISRQWTDSVGAPDGRALGLGGWSLSNHHAYDPFGRTLFLGDGNERRASSLSPVIITTVAGDGTDAFGGDNGPATKAQMRKPWSLAVGPDGSLYIADLSTLRIRRVAPDGVITTVAGNGTFGYSGDGGPATAAAMGSPVGIAVAPDGTLFIPDFGANRIRRVGLDGIITTVAGTGAYGFSGDGGPATAATLASPYGVAAGADGSFYIWDSNTYRSRRVGTDGIIYTVAGTGVNGFSGDGGPATAAMLSGSYDPITVAPDGALIVADTGYNRIRRIAPNGIITTVAGSVPGFGGDGGQATSALLWRPEHVALAPDGTLFIADAQNARVRRIGPDGVIRTMAGTGGVFSGDGGPPTAAGIQSMMGIALAPDGTLYISDQSNHRVRGIRSATLSLGAEDILLASENGNELYVFNSAGRHLKTLDALTGAVREQFTYSAAGYLTAITDAGGNVTTIQRSGAVVTAIVAPGGQITTLNVGPDGWLQAATNPAGETYAMTYFVNGLLQSFTDPRGKVHQYQYDPLGRLTRDANPAGGVQTLARVDLDDSHYRVTITTALGLVSTYDVEELPTGETRRTRTDPSGAVTQSLIRTDGSRRVTYPDGTVEDVVEGPDPRFGMQAPLVKSQTITTPGGIVTTRATVRAVTLSTPGDLLSMTSQTDTVTINGKIYTRTFDAATRKLTTTTPVGRQSVVTLDALGRVVSTQGDAAFGLAPVLASFDGQGKLVQLSHGAQSWTYGYDPQFRLVSRTDAAGATMAFGYDAALRRNQVTLPGGQVYRFLYDASGNRTQVTMPSLGVHGLDYNAVNEDAGYVPPGNAPYVISRDLDGRVNQVTLPTGRAETFAYDSKNRIASLGYPEASVAIAYAPGNLTSRVDTLTRTPTAPGPAQQGAFTYAGSLLTGVTWSGAAQGQYTYAYNSDFLLQNMALTSGSDVVNTPLTRDNDGLLTGVGPFTYARAGPAGAPSQIGDGTVVITYGYDTLGRIQNRTHTVGGQQKYAVQLTRDNVGRIATKVETIAGVPVNFAYTYDANGQLTEVRRAGVLVEQYAYDANRNRISRQVGGGPVQVSTYDAQDRLIQRDGQVNQFNADGYLAQRGGDTFQYSTAGELIKAVVGAQTITYAYDGLRRRTSRTDAGGTVQYLYGNPENALQLTHARDAGGVLTTYYYDEGRRLFALQRGASRFYVATDPLGSPRVVTDAAGTPVKVVEYDTFGAITQDSNPAFDLPIGFAGGLADGATGFVHFGMRDFDPPAGRWTARDPALFKSHQGNLYAYVSNNPVNLIDPVGFGSAGVGLCEGVCVGLKLGLEKTSDGWGISACVEAGFGAGNSIDVDPLGKIDDTGFSSEAKFAFKGGIAKLEGGVDVDDCGDFKPKAEACVGPLCANTGDEGKLSLDPEGNGKLKNPFKGAGLGVEGKLVVKNCQQAKW